MILGCCTTICASSKSRNRCFPSRIRFSHRFSIFYQPPRLINHFLSVMLLLGRDGDGCVGQITGEVGGVELASLEGDSPLTNELEDVVDDVSLGLRGTAGGAAARRAASVLTVTALAVAALAVAVLAVAVLAVAALLAIAALLTVAALLAVATLAADLALIEELESVAIKSGTSDHVAVGAGAAGARRTTALAVATLVATLTALATTLAALALTVLAILLALHNTAKEISKNTLNSADVRGRDWGGSTTLAPGKSGSRNTRNGNGANTRARQKAADGRTRDSDLTPSDGHSGGGSRQTAQNRASRTSRGGQGAQGRARNRDASLALVQDDGRGSDGSTRYIESAGRATRDDYNILGVALRQVESGLNGTTGAEEGVQLTANVLLASGKTASGSGLGTRVVLMIESV
ncbi:uncharacterized protein IWZ02DRAFT_225386 [Phyllosticta citriasiana]|uniref:Uncharacterized protein n=1 Tax=Phyllosticta citriasiana TaxID=595635 RepID=A0ABR1KTP5_9PEZI